MRRHLRYRPDDFLELGIRRRQQLVDIDRALRARYAVVAVKQALAEQLRVLPQSYRQFGAVADCPGAEHESVEKLSLSPGELAGLEGKLVDRRLGNERVIVGLRLAMQLGVIPGRRTDTQAEVLAPDRIDFRQQIQPLGHDAALLEVLVAGIEVERLRKCRCRVVGNEQAERVLERRIRLLSAHLQAALDGVVPAQVPVVVARLELGSPSRRGRQRCGGERREALFAQATPTVSAKVFSHCCLLE